MLLPEGIEDTYPVPSYIPFYQHNNVWNPSYYTDIECVAGFLLLIRIGFNPGELLDFLLGWTTLDIYDDDIGKRTKELEEKFVQPLNKPKNTENNE